VELLRAAQIAELLGVSRAEFQELAASDGFPPPHAYLNIGDVWRRDDIESWARATGRMPDSP
jgi:predicted DNA-binding transcriptional regulator AlpA